MHCPITLNGRQCILITRTSLLVLLQQQLLLYHGMLAMADFMGSRPTCMELPFFRWVRDAAWRQKISSKQNKDLFFKKAVVFCATSTISSPAPQMVCLRFHLQQIMGSECAVCGKHSLRKSITFWQPCSSEGHISVHIIFTTTPSICRIWIDVTHRGSQQHRGGTLGYIYIYMCVCVYRYVCGN